MALPQAPSVTTTRGQRFLINVLWSWLGGGVNLFAGIILTPYIIRKLGADGYGIWSLLFSLVSYYTLLDFGIRSAIIRYSAHFLARKEPSKINEIVNTAV